MGGSSTSFSKLTNRVFPRMPNFYGLILEQCELANQAAALLEEYVQTGNKSRADQILKLEQDSDTLRHRNLDVLKSAFATPMDREDIYRAYMTVDCIIAYAHNIVSGMDTLGIKTDKHITDMTAALRNAVETLSAGYKKLSTSPADADKDAQLVGQARKNIEKVFRTATSELFQNERYTEAHPNGTADTQTVNYILDIFRRREIYRHLFDAAIDMGNAGKVLHDIVVQVA
ncbi:MAG: DUF47 family protein [Magnetococcales bacterium]|nr:DUF47 family protein [Magnetococcales bacterium]NGZ05305.1 DUF47 family protein [Magnetococcales bacterium]